jgi:glutathione synthase/RimK-type ligase-like ATP-grasp enzyme
LSAAPRAVSRDRPVVGLAACAQFPDLFEEGPIILGALDDAGLAARIVVWTDPEVDWSSFDLVVANGIWDNIRRVDEFLSWTARLEEAGVPLVNSPATLRWNLDKRYLLQLEEGGVAVVPTMWIAPHDEQPIDARDWPTTEVVVKPTVSGGGFSTARYEPHERAAAQAHVADLVASGRTAMVQPYQPAVDTVGEVGLVFLGGEFSHAIHKDPMIRRGVGPLDNLIDNQVVTPVVPSDEQLAFGHRAVSAAEALLGPTTYARVDTVLDEDGAPALLELELLDPMLFFAVVHAGATHFARVLHERITVDAP